jgi:chromosome segregation ATPase
LRRLQAEHRLALSSLSLARARVAELEQEHAEEGGAVVPRAALTEAQEELEALEARLARRDAQVQQMRDLLVVARFAPNEGNTNHGNSAAQLMRELGAQNGIHVAHTGSSSPPASPSAARRFAGDGTLSTADFGSSVLHVRTGSVASVSSAAGGQEQIYGTAAGSSELAAENARLTRALKARSAELAQLQLSLQKSKAALHALQENSVERSTHLELVASVDSAAKDASRAEERLVSAVAQARHFAEALQAEQHARAELQREAEEALRSQRASFESELARAQEAVSAASSAAQNTSAEGAQAQQALRAAEADKQRLEHVVTTIAAQLEQLEQTAASFDAGDDDSQQQQSRRLGDAGRTPSRLPATRGRGLFSPSRSSGGNSGAGVALLGGVFGSPLPASSPFAAAFGASSSSLGASVTSTPAQPGGSSAAPLAVAAQVVSIAQSLDALHSSLSSWRERVVQLEEALQASEAQRAAEAAAAQGQLEGLRQQADAAVNDVSERLSRAEAAAHEAASTAASEHAGLERALQEAQQTVQASERQIDEAAREVLGLRQALQERTERAEASLSAQRAADESRVRAEARAQEADSERAALIQTRLALTALQQAHEGCESALALASDERRTLLLQLDHARSLEAEHALLSQRLAQAERRTQVVGADQHNVVQITRRVLVELCEVMHAAKIPQSSQFQFFLVFCQHRQLTSRALGVLCSRC